MLYQQVKPESEMRRIVLNKMYTREIIIYRDVLPKIKELLDSINYDTEIAPRCLIAQYKPISLLVLENLSESPMPYHSADRRQGLDFEQARSILGKLATFHACSILINERVIK